jgi:hypothetical protein
MIFNKKGSIMDPIQVGGLFLIIAVTLITSLYFWGTFTNVMAGAVADHSSNATIVATMNALTASYNTLDYMIPLLVGGLLIISLVFAFKTGSSVLYAYLSIVVWAFALLISAVFTNVFETFSTTFPTITAGLPILTFVMENIKWLILAWCFLITAVMFSRNKKEEEDIRSQYANMGGGYYG